MANSADPDQTAPSGAVWSESTLFAYAILSKTLVYEILGLLPYHPFICLLHFLSYQTSYQQLNFSMLQAILRSQAHINVFVTLGTLMFILSFVHFVIQQSALVIHPSDLLHSVHVMESVINEVLYYAVSRIVFFLLTYCSAEPGYTLLLQTV